MIHAWNIALENSREIRNKPKYIKLYNSLYHEFTENINRYRNFVSDTTDIAEEVMKYLRYGNFASEVGDLVLQALASVTKISAMIYTEDKEFRPIQSTFVKPVNCQSKGLINLLKRGQHYDVLVLGKTGEAM